MGAGQILAVRNSTWGGAAAGAADKEALTVVWDMVPKGVRPLPVGTMLNLRLLRPAERGAGYWCPCSMVCHSLGR